MNYPAELHELYASRRAAIRSRLREFSEVRKGEYFYELLYCILTPQSSAAHADRAVSLLREMRFAETGVNPEPILRDPSHYIRFHRTKAKHLLRAREEFAQIMEALENGFPPPELRSWLVKNVTGFGYKEATHFLRNIGKNGGLAILDRHILRNLKRFGAIRSVPSSLSKKQYLRLEKLFQQFSKTIGIPLDELDLLFWSMETGEIRK